MEDIESMGGAIMYVMESANESMTVDEIAGLAKESFGAQDWYDNATVPITLVTLARLGEISRYVFKGQMLYSRNKSE